MPYSTRKAVTALLTLLVLPLAPVGAWEPSAAAACKMEEVDRAWVVRALSNWRVAAHEKLKLPARPLPEIVAFDAKCAYRLASGAPLDSWRGEPHGGKIRLPDGGEMPFGVASFARPDPNGEKAYFVMSLPSVWRAAGVKSGLGVEGLMDGVLMHEIMHTEQAYFANPRLEELTRRYGLPDDISDDSLQETFEKNSAYVADYEAERDLLFAAAAAPSDAEAKRLAGQALDRMRARRAKWFVGTAEKWGPLEEVFLTMEGVGQWVAYAWYTDKAGANLAPEVALKEVRRGGRWWSQDEGLALFLVVDRLVPGWQRHAFAKEPATAQRLLEMAVRE